MHDKRGLSPDMRELAQLDHACSTQPRRRLDSVFYPFLSALFRFPSHLISWRSIVSSPIICPLPSRQLASQLLVSSRVLPVRQDSILGFQVLIFVVVLGGGAVIASNDNILALVGRFCVLVVVSAPIVTREN